MPVHKRTSVKALRRIAATIESLSSQFTISPSPLATIFASNSTSSTAQFSSSLSTQIQLPSAL